MDMCIYMHVYYVAIQQQFMMINNKRRQTFGGNCHTKPRASIRAAETYENVYGIVQ